MDASSLRIDFHASNLGFCRLHMTIKTQKREKARQVYTGGRDRLAFNLLRKN